MRKKRLQKLKQGSVTVEACFLLPFLVFIIFVFLSLCLYLHDRSVLSSCAAEMAGKGAVKKYQTEKELEEWLKGQAEELAKDRLLAMREFEVSIHVTARKITVAYTGRTLLLGGLAIREAEEAKRMNPVEFIRQSRLLGQLMEE